MDLVKAEAAVADLLAALEVDEGDHTADTPRRVAKAWKEVLAGYGDDPDRHLAVRFSAPANPGLVIVSNLPFASTCAHHLLPILGHATVAYRPRPGEDVVGLSKLARVLEGYARRLQVQERLGAQVAEALERNLAPVGAGCVITAVHGCMCIRGVMAWGAVTTTTSWAGAWTEPGHPDVETVQKAHGSRPVIPG